MTETQGGRWWLLGAVLAAVVSLVGLGLAWPGSVDDALDPGAETASGPQPAVITDSEGVQRFDRVGLRWTWFDAPLTPVDLGEARRLALPPESAAGRRWQRLPARARQTQQTPFASLASLPGGTPPDRVGQWWYLVDYLVPAGASGPLGLYVPRISGASVQVLRRQGDDWVLLWDGSDQWREQWNLPVLVDVGTSAAPGARVELALALTRPMEASHRLGRIRVGPLPVLRGRADWRLFWQHTVPRVASLSFAALGLMTALVWLSRRRDRAYLLFSLTSLAWLLRNLHYYVTFPTTPWAYEWFWWMSNASLSWVMVLNYLFALRFDRRSYPLLERCLVGFVVVSSLLTMPGPWPELGTLAQQHGVNAVVAAGVLGWLGWLVWHGGGRELLVIFLALLLTDVAGMQDLMLLAGAITPESVYMLPVGTLAILAAFLYAAQHRYAHAIRRVEQANAVLEKRLAEREAELQANHERLRGIEREQALLLERQRLMRDMHDGLGSTLMSSLVLVEQGQLDHRSLAELLRDCVDDLRLVIDSLEPIGHDLVTLLASLRHRLGRRLEAAGLHMDWEVDDVPPLEWLHPPDALQVLRIVQEALTNVLKHAAATRVRIRTMREGDWVQVLIEDDGQGFDPQTRSRGRGLTHLHQRAERLGGTVRIDSGPGAGTRVWLRLPLQRGSPA